MPNLFFTLLKYDLYKHSHTNTAFASTIFSLYRDWLTFSTNTFTHTHRPTSHSYLRVRYLPLAFINLARIYLIAKKFWILTFWFFCSLMLNLTVYFSAKKKKKTNSFLQCKLYFFHAVLIFYVAQKMYIFCSKIFQKTLFEDICV